MAKPGPKWIQLYRKGKLGLNGRRLVRAYVKNRASVVKLEKRHMRYLQDLHRSLGWIDIGYHRVFFPSGHVYGGRPLGTLGAHTKGANDRTGYAFVGNFEYDEPTNAAIDSFATQRRIDATKSFVGHFQVPGNATLCPGRNLKNYYNLGG